MKNEMKIWRGKINMMMLYIDQLLCLLDDNR